MLWGGRFKDELDRESFGFSSSFYYDYRLFPHEIEVNVAHVMMLNKIGILNDEEAILIAAGLEKLKDKYHPLEYNDVKAMHYEDVHSFVEEQLHSLIGDKALKVRAGRSRNDLVATSTVLWIKSSIHKVTLRIIDIVRILLEISEDNINTIIPSYTHLQRAQPVSLAFHLLSHVEKMKRDLDRLEAINHSLNECPLGSGAIAGSTLELDREYVAELLGFEKPTENAMDSVNNRDFILDFIHACSVGMLHLSSLCEEIVLWNTSEFAFIKLGDNVTTGSSLMPQKKNPDLAELVRGKAGRVNGNYVSVSMMMKATPFGYNRDYQEDKEALFDSFDTYSSSLLQVKKILSSSNFNKDRFVKELKNDFTLATDLADYLVRKGIKFKDAHDIIGQIVKSCEEKGSTFSELELKDFKNFSNFFERDVMEVINLDSALLQKKTYGSPNPEIISKSIDNNREYFHKLSKEISKS